MASACNQSKLTNVFTTGNIIGSSFLKTENKPLRVGNLHLRHILLAHVLQNGGQAILAKTSGKTLIGPTGEGTEGRGTFVSISSFS